jgi:hypothetical protein
VNYTWLHMVTYGYTGLTYQICPSFHYFNVKFSRASLNGVSTSLIHKLKRYIKRHTLSIPYNSIYKCAKSDGDFFNMGSFTRRKLSLNANEVATSLADHLPFVLRSEKLVMFPNCSVDTSQLDTFSTY